MNGCNIFNISRFATISLLKMVKVRLVKISFSQILMPVKCLFTAFGKI